ncbi:fungal-specific transcription factor domain-containing protein [Stachybotrys elegans]|uniref:Fungal-specific transcription factor domain-containing protein n=1 Tax=Stachybotrys elegans TaxID=80388 RepID=A0A8K0SNG4_9HYPO|nr:fungal-specific transcription factor domain-containing protein [Stachybotrys elegans]
MRYTGGVTVYQTTGPDAHTGPILAPGSGLPALNPRSCVTCRRRKVRCDKQMPCSNCRRAQIPCIFPAPGRAPRQPRPKDPNAPPKTTSQREMELVKRLKKLEGIVEELSGQIDVEAVGKAADSASGSPEPSYASLLPSVLRRKGSGPLEGTGASPKDTDSTSDHSSDTVKRRDAQQQIGRLVLNDHKGSTRYVSSGFWSKLNDELDSIREDTHKLTDEGSDSDDEPTPYQSPASNAWPQQDHHAFILGYRSSDVNLRNCHPAPAHVPFLWSAFQRNVDPLVKILHIPSTESIIRDATAAPESLPPATEALVFAIYYSAIISLEADEVMESMAMSRDDLLVQLRFASEQSLAKANYLNTSDLTVINAFALFLKVVRRNDDSRFCWALTGLLVRLAQGMGLHRDGRHFNLTPFETEMRRRTWWTIVTIDVRSSEELGTDLAIGDRTFDTQLPLNINDADISPESTVFPEPREGRSDCAVAHVRYEITLLTRRFHTSTSAMASESPQLGGASIADREKMLVDIYQRLESKFLKHVVDVSDPLYWVAALISRVIMAKMCLIIYQPMLFSNSTEELTEDIRERLLIAALEIIEFNHKLNTDPRCKHYRWLFLSYTNWPAIAYVLIESCRRAWSPLVERGWEVVNGYDRDPGELARSSDHISAFLPLRKLFVRARRHRVAELARLQANPEEARRLDHAERINPEHSRFDAVPGSESNMERVREKWRALVQPEGASAIPWAPTERQSAPPAGNQVQHSVFQPQMPQQKRRSSQQATRPEVAVNPSLPAPVEFPSVSMQYMDAFMAQPPNATVIADFWQISATAPDPKAQSYSITGASDPTSAYHQGHSMAAPQHSMSDQDILRQKAYMLHGAPEKDDCPPPYLWSGVYTNTGVAEHNEEIAPEDIDMLGDGFNWQDWSQSIRGLEMGTNQGQWGW